MSLPRRIVSPPMELELLFAANTTIDVVASATALTAAPATGTTAGGAASSISYFDVRGAKSLMLIPFGEGNNGVADYVISGYAPVAPATTVFLPAHITELQATFSTFAGPAGPPPLNADAKFADAGVVISGFATVVTTPGGVPTQVVVSVAGFAYVSVSVAIGTAAAANGLVGLVY